LTAIAFGTGSALRGKDAMEYVDRALEAGFSHIDTAAMYQNEDSVGLAIRESGLDRSDLYITTKYGGGDIQDSVRSSLYKLGVKSVDLYLIHNPRLVANDFEGAWAEFVKIKESGLAKSIGVSNFTVEQLQTIVKTGKTKPAVNQIRFHPYNYASYEDLLAYSAKHDIVIEAYGSLAPITTYPAGPLTPVLNQIAARIHGTPAQVIFKWVLAKGAVIVTTTSKPARLQEYLAVADLGAFGVSLLDLCGVLG
ncbi:Aldo/keto reductase, partial [Artomyces pyxidatus]